MVNDKGNHLSTFPTPSLSLVLLLLSLWQLLEKGLETGKKKHNLWLSVLWAQKTGWENHHGGGSKGWHCSTEETPSGGGINLCLKESFHLQEIHLEKGRLVFPAKVPSTKEGGALAVFLYVLTEGAILACPQRQYSVVALTLRVEHWSAQQPHVATTPRRRWTSDADRWRRACTDRRRLA